MTSGLRIGMSGPRVDTALMERYRALSAAIVSDSMFRLNGAGARLRPISDVPLCAAAFTVRTAPGDNLLVHKALDLAVPGEVLVVDAGGDLSNAIIGERMLKIAEDRGLAGFVINGAIRDYTVMKNASLPVFAVGVTHRGPYKHGPGEINYPIAIDGMVICPGDIIIGDGDGIVCVPIADAFVVCDEAERRAAQEANVDPSDEPRGWIDEKLAELGCILPEPKSSSVLHLEANRS